MRSKPFVLHAAVCPPQWVQRNNVVCGSSWLNRLPPPQKKTCRSLCESKRPRLISCALVLDSFLALSSSSRRPVHNIRRAIRCHATLSVTLNTSYWRQPVGSSLLLAGCKGIFDRFFPRKHCRPAEAMDYTVHVGARSYVLSLRSDVPGVQDRRWLAWCWNPATMNENTDTVGVSFRLRGLAPDLDSLSRAGCLPITVMCV